MSEEATTITKIAMSAVLQMTKPLAAMSPQAVAAVAQLEEQVLQCPQVEIPTEHAFHAGTYARTIMLKKDVVLTGALIKIPTILIISGDVLVYTDEGPVRMTGYNVMLGKAGRKQAFVAMQDTFLTMVFATDAKTVEEAEEEFTAEADRLFSRKDGAENTVMEA